MTRLKRSEVEKIRKVIRQLREVDPPITFEEIAKTLYEMGVRSKQMARYHYLKVIHNDDLQGKEK